MYLDKSLTLCDDTNFFGSAGTQYIGDIIDFGTKDDLRGAGNPLALVIIVTKAMVGGTNVQFRLRTANAVASNSLSGNQFNVFDTAGIPLASLMKGARYVAYMPYASWMTHDRYMQMHVTRGGVSTAGAIHAFLTLDGPVWVPQKAAPVQLI